MGKKLLSNNDMKAIEIINGCDCSAVKVGFGWVGEDRHVNDGLVIYDCPPIVIERLINDGYFLTLTNGFLRVWKPN